MRMDQFVGLSEKAKRFLRENAVADHFEIRKNGEVMEEYDEPRQIKGRHAYQEAIGFETHNLPGYQLKDGSVVFEIVQAEPWSSGHMYFTHLVDAIGTPLWELQWTEEEIAVNMIYQSVTDNVVLADMQRSSCIFHLTGSRFFKTENGNSDYDFFVKDSVDLQAWLKTWDFELLWAKDDLGFVVTLESLEGYYDQDIKAVYRYCGEGIQIDIQVVKDPERKQHVQNFIKRTPWILARLENMPKNCRHRVWNSLIELYCLGYTTGKKE
jgi:hypothetical protein